VIWPSDSVYLQVDKTEIKIFHVIDHTWEAWEDIKYNTKIIIFNKDYNFIHHWETLITLIWVHWDEFYWNAVYHLCWKEDGGSWYLRAYINCWIWDNEPTWIETQMFEKKAINFGKIILWNWIYNNAYTYLRVWTRENWHRVVKEIQPFWVFSLSQYYNWTLAWDWNISWLEGCLSLEREERLFDWKDYPAQAWRDWDKTVDDTRCWPSALYSCPTYVEDIAEWVNIHSDLYKLWWTNVIYIPVNTRPSDIIKIEFVCSWWDVAEFWWMLFEIQRNPISEIWSYGSNVVTDTSCNISIAW